MRTDYSVYPSSVGELIDSPNYIHTYIHTYIHKYKQLYSKNEEKVFLYDFGYLTREIRVDPAATADNYR